MDLRGHSLYMFGISCPLMLWEAELVETNFPHTTQVVMVEDSPYPKEETKLIWDERKSSFREECKKIFLPNFSPINPISNIT